MSEFDPNNFSHRYFRRLDEKIDRMLESQNDIKSRMSSIEEYMGYMMSSFGGLNKRMDRTDGRLDRVERRLGLINASVVEGQDPFEGPKS